MHAMCTFPAVGSQIEANLIDLLISFCAACEGFCDVCGGDIQAPADMHVQDFECQRCHQTFSRGDRLLGHAHHHTRLKPFFCTACPKTFSRRARLAEHQARFHGTEGGPVPKAEGGESEEGEE